jgi:hypothetical protein
LAAIFLPLAVRHDFWALLKMIRQLTTQGFNPTVFTLSFAFSAVMLSVKLQRHLLNFHAAVRTCRIVMQTTPADIFSKNRLPTCLVWTIDKSICTISLQVVLE